MPDLVPVVFLMLFSFFLYSDRKKDFLLRHRSPSSKDSASGPDPQYLRRTHGMHRHRIQTSHKAVTSTHDLFQSFRKTISSGRILVYIQTLIGLFIKHQPGWQDSKRMRDQKLIIIKSNSLNLLRYGGIIQRNCHFKIHAQFLVHGIDQFPSSSTPYRAITLSLYFQSSLHTDIPYKRS